MDYESRKVKWYWALLFSLYCIWTVNLMFKGNPLLYSRADLRSKLNDTEVTPLQTIPTHPTPVKITPTTFQSRYNLERTAVDPLGAPRSKNYIEYEHHAINLGIDEKFELANAASDSSGFYLSGKSRWVVAVNIDGSVRWKYRFKEAVTDHALLTVLLDETAAYLVHPSGEVVCLDKMSGEMHWQTTLKEELAATPILWQKNIIVPTKSTAQVRLAMVSRVNGEVGADSPHLEIKPGFQWTESPDLDVVIATIDNKVIAIERDGWQVQWTQTVTDPIKGPAVAVGGQIFVATLGAKIVKLDGSRKGKVDWEADLTKPPASAPSYIPIVNRVAVMDTSGWISVIDTKNGKVIVRYSSENRNPLVETWSARLKGQHIEEFHMDWLHKGWTLWTACYDSAFCIYTPNKGQIVNRISLTGRPLSLPLSVDHHLIFLTETKGGEYVLSQNFEESEIKKLRKEATASAGASDGR